MAVTHDVDIPKSATPRFPDRCVECGASAPGATCPVSTVFGRRKPLREEAFKSWTFEVPCCPDCARALRIGRWKARVLFFTAVGVAVGAMFGAVTLWPSLLDSWLMYVVVLAAVAVPIAVGQSIYTPSVEITPVGDELSFAFRDRAFAEGFAADNGATVG